MNSDLYFNQISELLLSNSKFGEDIKTVRKKFFRKIDHGIQKYISYDYNFSILRDKETLSDFRITVDGFMIKYKLTPRWRAYITNKVLLFPIDLNNGKLIVPEHISPGSPPDGSPGVIKVFNHKEELPSKFLLVGDEKEMDIKKKAVENSIGDFCFSKIKQRKRSIDRFDTYIRWYRMFQKYSSKNKSKENIYRKILFSDIRKRKDKEWPAKYHQYFKLDRGDIRLSGSFIYKETEKLQRTGEIIIRRAINLLNGIIYERTK